MSVIAKSIWPDHHARSAPVGGATSSQPEDLSQIAPPLADKRPFEIPSPHGTRHDEYYWLRDDTRSDPAVLAYLRAENAHTATVLSASGDLEKRLFAEMRARILEDDSSVPILDDGYYYYTRFEAGQQQPIYLRKKASLDAAEEVLLDGNELGRPHAFYRIGAYAISRDGRLCAFAEDTVGRNQFSLRIKDLATGTLLSDTASNIAPMLAWSSDNRTLYFVGKDTTTLREDRVYRLELGRPPAMIYREEDEQYYTSVRLSKSKRYVFIELRSTTNSETRLLDAQDPTSSPKLFLARKKDHLYSVDHLDNRFVMRTNEAAQNFRVMEVADGQQGDWGHWRELVPHRGDTLVESVAIYRRFIALSVRSGGLRKIEVLPIKHVDQGATTIAERYFVDANEPCYTMTLRDTPDADSPTLRYAYDSLVASTVVYDIEVNTKTRHLQKEQQVPTYDASEYTSEYLHASAACGAKIPISVVYKKTTLRDGTAPLYVYGYGSYGISMDPKLDTNRVSLLDRGFVVAIAHIRGGQEMGRAWYEDGKLDRKMNTFTDFVTATEFLVRQGYGARNKVFAQGGSAGGLLMGAVINLRPALFRGVVANVPFVDVVTTMLDETIPLTTNEFDEWGNPKQEAAYKTMLAYSPYDNVKIQDYPALYVHTGLWDSQVQYFEPAKWVARLRATKTDHNVLLLDTDMTSGHGGAAGRFDRLRQIARELAFILWILERPDARAGWE